MAAPVPASGVIWGQQSQLHICIGKEYRQKGDPPLFHCFLLFSTCCVHLQGARYISLQLNLTEAGGGGVEHPGPARGCVQADSLEGLQQRVGLSWP